MVINASIEVGAYGYLLFTFMVFCFYFQLSIEFAPFGVHYSTSNESSGPATTLFYQEPLDYPFYYFLYSTPPSAESCDLTSKCDDGIY